MLTPDRMGYGPMSLWGNPAVKTVVKLLRATLVKEKISLDNVNCPGPDRSELYFTSPTD